MVSGKVYLGLDLGSRRSKAVAVDCAGLPVARAARATGRSFETAARALQAELATLLPDGASVAGGVTTGEGRRRVAPTGVRRTGISCHARAAREQFPRELDLVDLGGRGCTVLRLGADGTVLHFLQQRRCAAGTGAFLEELARRLEVSPERMAQLATEGTPGARFRQSCSLFAAEAAVEAGGRLK